MNVQTLYFIQTCLEINDVHTLVTHTSVVDSPQCLVPPDALKCQLSSPLGYSSAFLTLYATEPAKTEPSMTDNFLIWHSGRNSLCRASF